MRTLFFAAALSLTTAPLAAQVTLGVDGSFQSHYVWRGVTFTGAPVFQPQISLGIGEFTVGAWANIEMVSADATALALRGQDNVGVGEIDYWAEYGRSVGVVDLAVGAVLYTFQGYPGSGDGNTFETYARGSLNHLPVTPTITLYQDLDLVQGTYLEASVGYEFPAAVSVWATTGFTVGQEVHDTDAGQGANFAASGLTHLEIGASTGFPVGPLTIGPALHLALSVDDATRVTGLSAGQQDRTAKAWIGFNVGWSRGFGQ